VSFFFLIFFVHYFRVLFIQFRYEFVLRKYHDILKDHKAIDFTDMLHLAIKLLRENQDILQQYTALFSSSLFLFPLPPPHPSLSLMCIYRYKEEYQYLLVDEYQDTSSLQFELLNLLMTDKVTIVGDDDQTVPFLQSSQALLPYNYFLCFFFS
jgi:superfamily I DNA/RNA helicase